MGIGTFQRRSVLGLGRAVRCIYIYFVARIVRSRAVAEFRPSARRRHGRWD